MSLALLLPAITTVLDKVFPDKDKANEAKIKLLEMQQQGELAVLESDLKVALAQAAINQEEAKSPSVFVSGWRPFIGWVGGLGLFYVFLGYPLASWWVAMHPTGIVPPVLASDNLLELVFSMLGLGGLRTYEKLKGIAAK